MCLSSLETQSILCKVTCHIKEVLIAFAGVVNLNRKSFHHQVLFYLILGILLSILCHVEQIKVWTLQELRMLCPRHNVNVNIVVLNCQKCNQCLKCQVSGDKSPGLLFEGVLKMSLSLSLALSVCFWSGHVSSSLGQGHLLSCSGQLKTGTTLYLSLSSFFLVRSCLLITLIKCLKGSKSLGLLFVWQK